MYISASDVTCVTINDKGSILCLTNLCYMNLGLCINNARFTEQIHSLSDNEGSNISCTNQNKHSSLNYNKLDWLSTFIAANPKELPAKHPILTKFIGEIRFRPLWNWKVRTLVLSKTIWIWTGPKLFWTYRWTRQKGLCQKAKEVHTYVLKT